ncbi:hypothetical protein TeGR_g972 [Tetraparma gracilis]|uniref:Uncharacterized protein n=1 Tax=Tetraparma gracilis TaxID=2962635 RepID=A0ABQ6MDU5_9STRA|nr:hypothetical protein TeGR_g972 [Tetraparma gracilis]
MSQPPPPPGGAPGGAPSGLDFSNLFAQAGMASPAPSPAPAPAPAPAPPPLPAAGGFFLNPALFAQSNAAAAAAPVSWPGMTYDDLQRSNPHAQTFITLLLSPPHANCYKELNHHDPALVGRFEAAGREVGACVALYSEALAKRAITGTASRAEGERREREMEARLRADPMDGEANKYFGEKIRRQNVDEQYQLMMENYMNAFAAAPQQGFAPNNGFNNAPNNGFGGMQQQVPQQQQQQMMMQQPPQQQQFAAAPQMAPAPAPTAADEDFGDFSSSAPAPAAANDGFGALGGLVSLDGLSSNSAAEQAKKKESGGGNAASSDHNSFQGLDGFGTGGPSLGMAGGPALGMAGGPAATPMGMGGGMGMQQPMGMGGMQGGMGMQPMGGAMPQGGMGMQQQPMGMGGMQQPMGMGGMQGGMGMQPMAGGMPQGGMGMQQQPMGGGMPQGGMGMQPGGFMQSPQGMGGGGNYQQQQLQQQQQNQFNSLGGF